VSPPTIDILTVFHDGRHLVEPYLESVRRIGTPTTLYLLDNASKDGTAEALGNRVAGLDSPCHFFRSDRNDGFARGINLLARQGRGEYVFLLNPDAEVAPDCLDRLIERAEADPGIAICEARQQPTEHPKAYDPATGETTWCSGAAALIRRTAFDEVGGFDDRIFFMYCEDVDLSWKLWLSGWKCVYVPEALVGHDTSQPRPRWRRRMENYYSFRNSLFLFHRFARKGDLSILLGFLLKRFMSQRYSLTRKALFTIAFADHIRYIPYLVTTRRKWGNRAHSWIRLTETSLSE
jgi:GT2 family glycosyltransferase